jgi:hypothetical protein
MKVYTSEEYAKHNGRAIVGEITAIKRQVVNGHASLVLYLRPDHGEEFGITMSRQMADDLTGMLGPHPLVVEFFNLN